MVGSIDTRPFQMDFFLDKSLEAVHFKERDPIEKELDELDKAFGYPISTSEIDKIAKATFSSSSYQNLKPREKENARNKLSAYRERVSLRKQSHRSNGAVVSVLRSIWRILEMIAAAVAASLITKSCEGDQDKENKDHDKDK